jgi:hypothetical protein
MQTNSSQSNSPLRWHEVGTIPLLHPTRAQLSRIALHPKATVARGVILSAIAGLTVWLVGPQRPLLYGWAADNLGFEAASRILALGAPAAMVFAMASLLVVAATSHALARAFGGSGTFRQLVFSWAVIPLPFIALSVLVSFIPALVPVSRPMTFTPMFVAVQFGTLALLVALNVYLSYVVVITYAAAEGMGAWKSLGLIVLEVVVASIALACLSAAASGALSTLRWP